MPNSNKEWYKFGEYLNNIKTKKTMENLTEEVLRKSPEFKEWIDGRVALIHNTYWDSEGDYNALIVLHSDMGKWTITRFFLGAGKIQVSVDFTNKSTEETFKILLSEYSRGLK